jgi:integrase
MGRQPNRRPKIRPYGDRWRIDVTVGTKPDGSLDRRKLTGKTAAAVAAKYDALMEQLGQGHVPEIGTAPTVAEWLRHWLQHIVKPNRRYKTYAAYKPIVQTHLIPRIGQWRLAGTTRLIQPEHVEQAYADLREAGMAPAYVLQCHRVLSRALKVAHRRGRAARNVCSLIDAPDGTAKRIKPLDLDAVKKVLMAIVDDRLEARWLIALMLGLRQGEVLGLRWSQIHLDGEAPYLDLEKQAQRRTWRHGCKDQAACAAQRCRQKPCPRRWEHGCADPGTCKGRPHYCPQRQVLPGCSRHSRPCPPLCPPGCTDHARGCPDRTGGGIVDVDLKTDSVRPLALDPMLVAALRRHRDRQAAEQQDSGPVWAEHDLVFCQPTGARLDSRQDHALWEQVLVNAGVPDARLHAARHTAGTLLVATGTDIRVVQEILGHARITTTQRYVDPSEAMKRQAVARLGEMLASGEVALSLLRPSGAAIPGIT